MAVAVANVFCVSKEIVKQNPDTARSSANNIFPLMGVELA